MSNEQTCQELNMLLYRMQTFLTDKEVSAVLSAIYKLQDKEVSNFDEVSDA